MATVTIQEATTNLPDIIANLQPGEEVVITENGKPLAHVKKAERTDVPACRPGTAKDSILWISPDFDAPLDDFKEYME